jgi:hypothetical protein
MSSSAISAAVAAATNTATTIKIPIIEFARTNRGLIRVLKIVQEAGPSGTSTRRLLYKVRMIEYGLTLIQRAEELMYTVESC